MKAQLAQRHLLGIRGLSADEINYFLDTAESFREINAREIKKVPTLRGRTVINLFFEPSTGAPHQLARVCNASVVNAGDGAHEHPTQALLDALTIRQRKGSVKGLRVAILGDILHSRVARSNDHLLTTLGASVALA